MYIVFHTQDENHVSARDPGFIVLVLFPLFFCLLHPRFPSNLPTFTPIETLGIVDYGEKQLPSQLTRRFSIKALEILRSPNHKFLRCSLWLLYFRE